MSHFFIHQYKNYIFEGFQRRRKKMCQWLFTLQSFKYQGCRSERGGKHDLSFSFSLFILYIYHSGNQRHSINASFQFYFVLELGGCTFFLLLLSAVMLLHNLTTSILDAVWWCAKGFECASAFVNDQAICFYAVNHVHNNNNNNKDWWLVLYCLLRW